MSNTHEAEDSQCTCNDCIEAHEQRLRDADDAAEAIRRVDARHKYEQDHREEGPIDDETGERML